MNVPNKLTVSRFILTIAFLAVFFSRIRYHETIALVLFCVAGATIAARWSMAPETVNAWLRISTATTVMTAG
mgnify:CR=1 FL=1